MVHQSDALSKMARARSAAQRAMLAQIETKSKASLGGRNGRTDKSEGSDPKYDRLKRDLTFALLEISNLKNQLNQAQENIAKERAECGSKSKKDDSPEAEVGGKRPRQQAKRAKASKPTTSSPSPSRKGFRMLPTGRNSDLEEDEDYPDSNARATYAHAKFARILPPSQKKTSQLEVEPRPIRIKALAGRVMTRTHQRLIDVAIDSLQDDEDSGPPDLESDYDEQGTENVAPQLAVQDDGMIEFMHNINIMQYPDEIIRSHKQTNQIVLLRNIVHGPIEPTVTQLESWAVSDNGASDAFNMYEANDIWMQH
jgi:hypothetical protein